MDVQEKIRNPGRRALRDEIAKGVRVLIPSRPSARHEQPVFKEPERWPEQSIGEGDLADTIPQESQRHFAFRCADARAAFDRAQRALRAKGLGFGPNAWKANPHTRVPYPPTEELEEQLATIRRQQRNERRRGRVPGVPGSPNGAGWTPSGKKLETRRAAYLQKLFLRRLARRVKRHGGAFSKQSRMILAAMQAERGVK